MSSETHSSLLKILHYRNFTFISLFSILILPYGKNNIKNYSVIVNNRLKKLNFSLKNVIKTIFFIRLIIQFG